MAKLPRNQRKNYKKNKNIQKMILLNERMNKTTSIEDAKEILQEGIALMEEMVKETKKMNEKIDRIEI